MQIAFFGDSLTAGRPGASYLDVLRRLLPEHELLNYGRGGDSVIALSRRVARLGPADSFDLAFVWIGANDVFVKTSWTFPPLRRLLGQPWAQSRDEFRRYYRSILDDLHPRARQVNTVPPLLIGEALGNPWNAELEDLAAEITALSTTYRNVRYVDLRAVFKLQLSSKQVSDYVAAGALGVAWDVLLGRDLQRIDERSRARGLHYTLDGVHLNSRGAEMVAEAFAQIIRSS